MTDPLDPMTPGVRAEVFYRPCWWTSRSFFWRVTDHTRISIVRVKGRSTSESFAIHDARKAMFEIVREENLRQSNKNPLWTDSMAFKSDDDDAH